MKKGLVTIIMPLFNAEQYVSKAIDSVIKQEYDSWELIIVDDGSKDNSLSIAWKYASNKIKIYTQENKGACAARNKALSEATGEYVKFLDADDILTSDCLKIQVNQIKSLNNDQIPFGDYDFIDSDGNLKFHYVFDKSDELNKDQESFFFSHWEILISSPLHRMSYLNKIGGFDESLKRGQEFDFHFRLALAGCNFVYLPVNTFGYRSHNSVTRISTGTKNKSYQNSGYLANRYNKFEGLLTQKYGAVPPKYYSRCFDFWFSWARDSFANKERVVGLDAMKHANRFSSSASSFFRAYKAAGTIIGFVMLESIFRLRLKLFSKKTGGDSLKGTSQYI